MMRVRPLANTQPQLFCIENEGGEMLRECPCCGNGFKTEDAAEAVVAAINAGQWTWAMAMLLQQEGREWKH